MTKEIAMDKVILLVTNKKQEEVCRHAFKKHNDDSVLVMSVGGKITEIDMNVPVSIEGEHKVKEHWVLASNKQRILDVLQSHYNEGYRFVLASDGGIESEKIGFDLSQLVCKDRIKISHLSKMKYKDIRGSILSARSIDQDRARAAAVRRVVDALIGIRLSKVMRWDLKREGFVLGDKKLSIGRLMSPALKILCDNQKDIISHESEQYVRIKCWYRKGDQQFEFLDKTRFFIDDYNQVVQQKELKDKLAGNPHVVVNYTQKQREEYPPEPFFLSSLEVAVFNAYRWRSDETASLARDLYVYGYITNFKSNSNRIEEGIMEQMISYLYRTWDEDEVVDIPRRFKERSDVQEAEYAITPAEISDRTSPENIKTLWESNGHDNVLDGRHYKVYMLIWFRTLATQVENGFFDSTELSIEVLDHKMKIVANKPIEVVNEDGEKKKKLGWLGLNETLLRNSLTVNEDRPMYEEVDIPFYEIGESLTCTDITNFETGTRPPRRYGEARFIKTLEKMNIAQPITLSSLPRRIVDNGLASYSGIVLHVKPLGMRMNDWIEKKASFLHDLEEVTNISNDLKMIERGEHPSPDDLIKAILHRIQVIEEETGYLEEMRDCTIPSVLQKERARAIASRKGIVLGDLVLTSSERIEVFLRKYGDETEEQKVNFPKEALGLCPLCKEGKVSRNANFYACSNYRDKGCKFGVNIGYSKQFLENYGKEFNTDKFLDSIIKSVLSKGFAVVHNMESKEGRRFSGKLGLLSKNGFWNIGFVKKEA